MGLRYRLLTVLLAGAAFSANPALGQVPDAISAPGETVVATFHAEGAQIYECKPDPGGKLAWAFREPIATLLRDGATVGRHYAGPTWEATDGSAVSGKAVANVAGSSPSDVPWLRLEVIARRGAGTLASVTTVQRTNTHGGVANGVCDKAGSFYSVPYSADYVFLKK